MSRCFDFSFSRALCSAVVLFSWLVISNHCALGHLLKGARAVRECANCAGEKSAKNGEKSPAHETRECCKTIHALPQKVSAKFSELETAPLLFALVWNSLQGLLLSQPPRENEPPETGPPPAQSFVEIVLQRSLLSHAPPFAS